jgi:hypothetical protein
MTLSPPQVNIIQTLYYCLDDFPYFQGKPAILDKVLLPQILKGFDSIYYLKVKIQQRKGIAISNSLKQQFTMAKFIKRET